MVRNSKNPAAVGADAETHNDIRGLLASHPTITRLGFNGAKAKATFVRHNPDFTLHDMVHATMFRENIMPSTILLEGLEKDNLAMVSLVRFVVISTSSTTGGDTTAKA